MHRRYDRLARGLLAAGKFEEARVACLRGLAVENSEQDRAQWLFYLAVALNGLGQQHDAVALVNAAAPLDHPGCVEAHLLVAQNLLNSTNLTTDTENLHLAEHHLLNALALDPSSLAANEDMARFDINTHKLAKARARLMKIYPRKPDTALLLAISYDMETNGTSAVRWADRAVCRLRAKPHSIRATIQSGRPAGLGASLDDQAKIYAAPANCGTGRACLGARQGGSARQPGDLAGYCESFNDQWQI